MHLLIAIDGSPVIQDELLKNLQNRKYPYEGKSKTGYNIPDINEIRFYNIRCKEEVAPMVLRDLVVFDLTNPASLSSIQYNTDINNHMNRTANIGSVKKPMLKVKIKHLILRITHKLYMKIIGVMGIKSVTPAKEGFNPLVSSYKNAFFIGAFEDIKDTKMGELLVLMLFGCLIGVKILGI